MVTACPIDAVRQVCIKIVVCIRVQMMFGAAAAHVKTQTLRRWTVQEVLHPGPKDAAFKLCLSSQMKIAKSG